MFSFLHHYALRDTSWSNFFPNSSFLSIATRISDHYCYCCFFCFRWFVPTSVITYRFLFVRPFVPRTFSVFRSSMSFISKHMFRNTHTHTMNFITVNICSVFKLRVGVKYRKNWNCFTRQNLMKQAKLCETFPSFFYYGVRVILVGFTHYGFIYAKSAQKNLKVFGSE